MALSSSMSLWMEWLAALPWALSPAPLVLLEMLLGSFQVLQASSSMGLLGSLVGRLGSLVPGTSVGRISLPGPPQSGPWGLSFKTRYFQ